jgi:hypothetical protein
MMRVTRVIGMLQRQKWKQEEYLVGRILGIRTLKPHPLTCYLYFSKKAIRSAYYTPLSVFSTT